MKQIIKSERTSIQTLAHETKRMNGKTKEKRRTKTPVENDDNNDEMKFNWRYLINCSQSRKVASVEFRQFGRKEYSIL